MAKLVPYFLCVIIAFLGVLSPAFGRKVPFGHVGSELGDYRLATGDPFITLFEHENYRGKLYRQKVNKDCSNIPRTYRNWSSSIMLHGRCVTVCDARNCEGRCQNLYPDQKGIPRLNKVGLNDNAKSLRFCYKLF